MKKLQILFRTTAKNARKARIAGLEASLAGRPVASAEWQARAVDEQAKAAAALRKADKLGQRWAVRTRTWAAG